eukprot:TRINITY_DN757_c0_g1_i5.p1 TRINITY_DN757_c0_g1~~TRINITY_DN757_c0_g1_i5.p1  ORF type:complete len:352 (+),score=171.68 TRINITY_DN757_c0_g1_i5:149-1204(+)
MAEEEVQALKWICDVLGEAVPEDPFEVALKSGILLCQLMKKLDPKSVKKIHKGKMPFMQMENIQTFVDAARKYGVPEHDLFVTVDLFEAKNIKQVVQCVFSLSRVATKNGFEGECLGPRLVEKKVREKSAEEKIRARAEIPLFAAMANTHASQSGSSYGRDVVRVKGGAPKGKKIEGESVEPKEEVVEEEDEAKEEEVKEEEPKEEEPEEEVKEEEPKEEEPKEEEVKEEEEEPKEVEEPKEEEPEEEVKEEEPKEGRRTKGGGSQGGGRRAKRRGSQGGGGGRAKGGGSQGGGRRAKRRGSQGGGGGTKGGGRTKRRGTRRRGQGGRRTKGGGSQGGGRRAKRRGSRAKG